MRRLEGVISLLLCAIILVAGARQNPTTDTTEGWAPQAGGAHHTQYYTDLKAPEKEKEAQTATATTRFADPGWNITSTGGIDVVSTTVWIATPSLCDESIEDMEVAIFEIEFEDDLYFDGYSLSELALDSLVWDDGELYAGEIGWVLAGSAVLNCPGFFTPLIGGVHGEIGEAPLFVLPAVENPLGLVYGWQFDDSLEWPANKLILALPLNVIKESDDGVYAADLVWDLDIFDLMDCEVEFASWLTNSSGLDSPATVVGFDEKEFECVEDDLDALASTLAYARSNFDENMISWAIWYELDIEIAVEMATATWQFAPTWVGCETVLANVTGWTSAVDSYNTTECAELSEVVNTTCMMLEQDYYKCQMENDAFFEDPCCYDEYDGCCADFESYSFVDEFDVSTEQCLSPDVMGITLDSFAEGAPETASTCSLDAFLDAETEILLAMGLYEYCEEQVFIPTECTAALDCWSGTCLEGVCVIPPKQYSFAPIIACFAGTAMIYEANTYSALNAYLLENYVSPSHVGSYKDMVLDVVYAVTYASCAGPTGYLYDADVTYECEEGVPDGTEDLWVCWEDWTLTNQEGCTTQKYCNWDKTIRNATICNATASFMPGFCVNIATSESITIPSACYLYLIEDEVSCAAEAGEWIDGMDACIVPDVDTEDDCIPTEFSAWGDDSFTALLPYTSYCFNDLNETECLWLWVPTIELCMNPLITQEVCYMLGQENLWWEARAWMGRYDTLAECSAGKCDIQEGFEDILDVEECELYGWCDVYCSACTGGALCYVENITTAECNHVGGKMESNYLCALPAKNEEECLVYEGEWFYCGDLDIDVCEDSNILVCVVDEEAECGDEASCIDEWECVGDGVWDFCLVECQGDEPEEEWSIIPGYCFDWYSSEEQCATLGIWVPEPTTAEECDGLLPEFLGCLMDGEWYDLEEYANCEECGGEELPYYHSINGTWTVSEQEYGQALGWTWVTTGMQSMNRIFTVENETAWEEFTNGFEYELYQGAYEEYMGCMLNSELSTMESVACDCNGGDVPCFNSPRPPTPVASLVITTAVDLSFPPTFPGGSQLKLEIPAGLVGVTIDVAASSALDYLNTAKRSSTVEVILSSAEYGDVGDLYGDGFEFTFSVSPLPVPLTVCMSAASYLIVQPIYSAPDFASYSASEFVIELIADAVLESPDLCGSITESGMYFPVKRISPFPPVISSSPTPSSSTPPSEIAQSSSSGGGGKSLAALAALVLLLLIPVAVVGVVFVLRSKHCRKKLRRVAPS